MGTTIAQLSALKGYKVLVKALNADRQQLAVDKIREHVQRFGPGDAGEIVSLTDFAGLHDADIVLEACAEDEAMKEQVLKDISQSVREDCIIATNTSSLSVGALAQHVSDKQNFLGLHFFHPVDKMPLVEVISQDATARDTIARAGGFICHLAKTPVTMKDSPSFLVNRFRLPLSWARLLGWRSWNLPLNWIEDAGLYFGMPMPPFVLSDEIGLDVAYQCAISLEKAFGAFMAPPTVLRRMLDAGLIGRKTGRGIYNYSEKGAKLGFDASLFDGMGCIFSEEKASQAVLDEMAEMLILPMIDEACRCLEQKVVRRPREIDLCAVLGIGFPPFRGGLLRYADTIGARGADH